MPLKPEMSSELRHMVRDVLREVLPQRSPGGGGAVETVRIASDGDLAAFVARIIEPATLDRLRAGTLRFTLGGTPAPAPAQPIPHAAATVLTGVITEQKIAQLKGGSHAVLGPGAVLTPLARDRARKLGLIIERRR